LRHSFKGSSVTTPAAAEVDEQLTLLGAVDLDLGVALP
jgi:hypothetical protein